MTTRWELSEETFTALIDAATAAQQEITELGETYTRHDEEWRESAKGQAVGQWLSDLDQVMTAIDEMQRQHE